MSDSHINLVYYKNGGGIFFDPTGISVKADRDFAHFVWHVVFYSLLFCFVVTAVSLLCSTVKDAPVCTHAPRHVTMSRSCAGHAPDALDIGSLKTGDLLVVSYKGIRSIFSSIFYRSIWTHPGIVWIDPTTGEPFMLEAALYMPPYTAQVVRVPILHWMRINRNSNCVAHLSINKEADPCLIDAGFSRFEKEDVGVEGLNFSWFRFCGTRNPMNVAKDSFFASTCRRQRPANKSYPSFNIVDRVKDSLSHVLPQSKKNEEKSNKFDYTLTCHEIIISTLQFAGVFSKEKTPCSYMPSALARREIQTLNGYKYSAPKEVSLRALVAVGRL
jgi:hypothetical protein